VGPCEADRDWTFLIAMIFVDVCYKPADMCSPEHLEERKQAAAKYYNMVSPLLSLSLRQIILSSDNLCLCSCAVVLVVSRPYLRSGCHQPSSCRQVRTFETFPAYRED
jgi:hypothetical protein